MRRTLLAFFGLAFVIYWLFTADLSNDGQAALDPVLPSLVRILSPTTSVRETELRKWLKGQSAQLSVDHIPDKTLTLLKEKALSLNVEDLEVLKEISLRTSAADQERLLAVYTIGLSEIAESRRALREIGQRSFPQTVTERASRIETRVRTQAQDSLKRALSPTKID